MSMLPALLWLIPVLPLCAAILTAFLGPRLLRQHSHWPALIACVGSCVLAFFVLSAVMHQRGEEHAAESVHVAAGVELAALDLLGRRIVRSTDPVAGRGQRRGPVALGEPEVGQVDVRPPVEARD